MKKLAMGMFAALITQLSFAQNGNPAYDLGEIIVTPSRMEETTAEVTSNVTVIDKQEIENSSARDLGELLAEEGIGYIKEYPGALTSFGIRGFRTETHGNDLESHVLVLLNGRRAGTGNIAKIMIKNIERVEIVRGPASAQYGSAAMGGVVNVITKQGTGKPTGFAEGKLGSFGYEEKSVGFSGKVKKIDFSGSYSRSSMDDYDIPDGQTYYNTGYDKKEYCSLNLGYEFLPDNRIGIIYTYFDSEDVGNPYYLSQNDLDDYTEPSNESIDFIYDGQIPKEPYLWSWKIRYFDGKDTDKWYDPTGSNPGYGLDDGVVSWQKTDQKGMQAQVSLKREAWFITTGFDWVNYKINATWSPKKSEYDNPSYFLLGKTKLLDKKLILSGGLRYDKYEVKIKSGEGGTQSDHHLTPRVGLAYFLKDNLKLRLQYGEAFKMPSAKQLAYDYTASGKHYVGNPDLNPEKSRTYEGGLDFTYKNFYSSLTYFYTDFKDKIQTYTTAGGDTSWKNLGGAEIQGLEGDFSYDVGSLFSWDFELKPYLNFLYLTNYEDEETGEDLKYTCDWNLSSGITVSDRKGLSADLNLRYVGEQKITDYEGGTYATIHKSGFTVANLAISKKIIEGKYGGLTLKGEIRNLFDRDYEYVQGYPMPGRSFFFTIKYNF